MNDNLTAIIFFLMIILSVFLFRGEPDIGDVVRMKITGECAP